jgi:predicted unusual protein kinase regulating ubiquinone biosynthesis (AarF/ABC1/UbiB family)
MATMTAILVCAALAAALLLLMLVVGRSPRLRSGRAARLVTVGRLSARLSASWLGATIRRMFARGERRARIDQARREADAARVAETMGQMKGAFMKLGQMLSFISDDIPPEYRAALASLQASAPPMDFALLRDVAERELGRPLERAFARFDAVPLASASIGQVHRAQLPSGEEVAVKIQYPGVAEAMRGDLDNVAVMYRMMPLLYPGVEPAPIVEELRSRFLEELDYRREARNQRAFYDLYAGHPFIRVPRVIDSHSTDRVLTTEFVAGRRFGEMKAGDDAVRARSAEILYRFVIGSLLGFGVFNGDPHPGNYLFDDDGRVVFLDFGCVKYFPEAMLHRWTCLVDAHLAGDRGEFQRRLVELGFLPHDAALDGDVLYDYFAYFYEPFRIDRAFTFSRAYNAQSFGIVFKPEGRFAPIGKIVNMPADFVFVNRIQWGVYSLLGDLQATGNWHRIDAEYRRGAPPSTELGELDQAFRARWRRERGLPDGRLALTPDGVRRRAVG